MELFIIPLIFTLVAAIAPKTLVRYVGLAGALTSLVATIVRVSWFQPDQLVSLYDPQTQFGLGVTFKMAYDGIGLLMVLLTSVMILLIVLANMNRPLANEKSFNSMVFLMQFALVGVFTAWDGIMFYIFWEITLIPVFLISWWYGSPDRKNALLRFFVFTFVGSLAMLGSLITLGVYADDFSYETLTSMQLSAKTAYWVMAGFFLAFAIKIPLVPFHIWQPSTYTVSPMAGTMLLAALMLKMALYGMIRWMIPVAPEALEAFKMPILILGLIGVVYAAIIAIKQQDIKTLFAYASISHVGLIAAGIVLFDKEILTGSLIQMVNHSLVAVGLFLAADVLENRLGTRKLTELGGVAKLAPKFALWFGIIGFVSISVPFTSGFIGEFLLIKGLYDFNWISGLIAGSTLIFGAVYTLRAYQLSMFGAPKFDHFKDLSWNETLTFFIIAILAVVIGVYPQYIIEFVGPSLEKLVQAANTIVR